MVMIGLDEDGTVTVYYSDGSFETFTKEEWNTYPSDEDEE